MERIQIFNRIEVFLLVENVYVLLLEVGVFILFEDL